MKLLFALLTFLSSAHAFANTTAHVNIFSYAATNVTTGAAVVLVASSPLAYGHLEVCDTSGKQLVVSAGASPAAVSLFTVAANACIVVPGYMPPGTQFNIQAIDAAATSGYNLMSFLP